MKEGSMTVEKFLEEAEVMKKLRHPRLVTLYAVCTQEQPIYIVTELMKGGSLLSYLRDKNNKSKITIENIIDMAAQVYCSLSLAIGPVGSMEMYAFYYSSIYYSSKTPCILMLTRIQYIGPVGWKCMFLFVVC